MSTKCAVKGLVLYALAVFSAPAIATAPDDAAILARLQSINEQLASQGFNFAIGQVDLFTIGQGRPSYRLIQNDFRFVPYDARRNADGAKIRYLVDSTADQPFQGDTSSGLTHVQTEAAIDAAINTWQAQRCLRDVQIVKRSVPDGTDPDLFDYFFAGNGHPPSQVQLFHADIIHGGWLPLSAYFGPEVLGITISAYFVQNGRPTDINGDGYADTAWTETYYNDDFRWGIDVFSGAIDVQTVALHESGHALGLGHFGPPPVAVMNPSYGGLKQAPLPTDDAGLCAAWGSWPR